MALVAHPDDARYQPLFGTTVRTPLFGVEVPVHAHPLADPEKGSGIAMICTFGDTTDVIWWRELDLPVRSMVGRDGRVLPTPPEGVGAPYDELAGKNVKQAQRRIVELLAESGDLVGEPRPITHPVKFFEKGDRPLEVVTSRQWYIRNGGRDETRRAELLQRGKELSWHPGAHADPLRQLGRRPQRRLADQPAALLRRADPALVPPRRRRASRSTPTRWRPAEAALPVDPSSDVPAGFTEDQRGVPGGFIGDPDVMDTWATSSASPRRSPAAGRTTRTCSRRSSRWTCARRARRSSGPGCSRPSCARTSSTASCPGATP